jgi:hypothetical protein
MRTRIQRALALLCLVLCSLLPVPAWGHTATFSVLIVRERSPGEFVTSWEKTERIEDPSAAYDLLRPVFPEHCLFAPPHLDCGAAGLSGPVGFDGLGDLSTSGIIKIQWADGKTQLLSLSAAAPQIRVSQGNEGVSLRSVFGFIGLGVTHIWFGWDHLLFVFGLLWFLESWGALLRTITAFTIAHSLTLGAATFGFRVLPAAPVEAVIALSIAFVAVEIVRETRGGRRSLTRRRPWIVAFAFGLIHGFGFASALGALQLAKTELSIALFCFNVGVELGQLAFVASVLRLRPVWRKLEHALGARVANAFHYAMGSLAMYWFFERIVAFLPLV